MKLTIVVLLLFVSLAATFAICDFDIWYHLATGKHILTTHEIPTQDIFSYTAFGKPWVSATWLTQCIFYLLFLMGGLNALVLFKVFVLTLTFFVILLLMRLRKVDLFMGVLTVILTVLVARSRFTVRPHILSLLFLSIYSYILFDFSRKNSKIIWTLLPLQLIWSNLHSESLLGIALVSIYFISRIIKRDYKSEKTKILFTILVGVGLLSLVTPHGWRSIFYGFFTLDKTILRKYILEFRPTDFSNNFFAFWFLFSVGLASFFVNKRRNLEDVFIFIIFSYLAIKVNRFGAEFAVLACPIIALNLTNSLELFLKEDILVKWKRTSSGKTLNFVLIVIIIFFGVTFLKHSERKIKFGLGINYDNFPVEAARFIKEKNVMGNMFNTMGLGGYLIWRLYPDRKVFIDGRTDVYGPDLLYREVMSYQPKVWEELDKEFDLDYALIDNISMKVMYDSYGLDMHRDKWALIFWNDNSFLYVKRDGKNKALAEKYEYKYLFPDNPNLSYLDKYLKDENDKKNLIAELRRNIKENPYGIIARTSLANVYIKEKESDKAIRELKDALKVSPKHYGLYGKLGLAYLQKEEYDKAMEAYKKAVSLNPKFLNGRINLGTLYFRKKDYKKAISEYKIAIKIDPNDNTIRDSLNFMQDSLIKEREENIPASK